MRRTGLLMSTAGAGLVALVAFWTLAAPAGFKEAVMSTLFGDLPSSSALSPSYGDLLDVQITVNVNAAGTPISSYIYGVAGADPQTLRELGATLNRWGGNPASRYNWVNGHAWNAGRDWQFRNVDYGSATGSAADQFVSEALSNGAVPLLTVPTIGWVARNDDNGVRSMGVPPHGGAPVQAGSSAISGYDPAQNRLATSVPSLPSRAAAAQLGPAATDAVYEDQWIQHLVTQFGAGSQATGLLAMDNEPDLWSETHTDVHPTQMSYDDMLRTYESYALAVKAQAPRARVLGPDVSGWTSFWYSALDRGDDNFATHADRNAHGGQPFLAWWLAQVARADRANGRRSLDLLDVHYYPQAYQVDSSASDPATQELRIRSTRSLYDPEYSDESWINEPVMLIPRLKQWIADSYPGTGIAITEYRWGGEGDASGAVALADVLGIFGREGISVASYWTFPKPQSPAGAAFRLYANFDGKGARFGDRSLPAISSDRGVAVFASRHSDTHEIDIVLIDQSLQRDATIKLKLPIKTPGAIDLYQVAAGSGEITKSSLAGIPSTMILPAGSINLLRIPAASQS